jgi:hypothetical protein
MQLFTGMLYTSQELPMSEPYVSIKSRRVECWFRVVFFSLAMICTINGSVAAQSPSLDSDGVQMLFPSADGAHFQLAQANPNHLPQFVIEKDTVATLLKDGGISYWNLPSYPIKYSSGGKGLTSRLHIRTGDSPQVFDWRSQKGYLSTPTDLKNQEFTVFIRVHQIVDARRAQISLKIRGGAHSAKAPENAACVLMTFSPAAHGSITRFGKELTHPKYDCVTLNPKCAASLTENAWVGLKLVSWNDPSDAKRVINRLYIDTMPFDRDSGRPQNHWQLFSEYVDIAGKSTGNYSTLVNWGAWQTTLRTDGFASIDFTLVSVREIQPPEQ